MAPALPHREAVGVVIRGLSHPGAGRTRQTHLPGGYAPALSKVMPAVERSGPVATRIEVLRLHCTETPRHWRRRLSARPGAVVALHDERSCRMFEFHLSGAELAFRHKEHMA